MNGISQLGLTVYLKQDDWYIPTRKWYIPTKINSMSQLG